MNVSVSVTKWIAGKLRIAGVGKLRRTWVLGQMLCPLFPPLLSILSKYLRSSLTPLRSNTGERRRTWLIRGACGGKYLPAMGVMVYKSGRLDGEASARTRIQEGS